MPAVTMIPIHSVRTGRVENLSPEVKSEAEWKALLTQDQFNIARNKGTELAFTGVYYDCKKKGIYQCVCCGTDLFLSDAKFDSGTGWPSFLAPVSPLNITMVPDRSAGMIRTEVLCARCGAHLGHVFDDGPPPAHKRYCMNSASLNLVQNLP